jgi:hypothetical protein
MEYLLFEPCGKELKNVIKVCELVMDVMVMGFKEVL